MQRDHLGKYEQTAETRRTQRKTVAGKSLRPSRLCGFIGRAGVAFAGVALVFALSLAAQPFSFGKVSGLRYQDFFEAPNQSKVRAFVRGAEAVPAGTNRVQVTQLHIETFRLDGTLESILDAPECVFDYATRTASSDGQIAARTADGQVRADGTGFLFTLTNKSLVISNNFRTVIRDLGNISKKP